MSIHRADETQSRRRFSVSTLFSVESRNYFMLLSVVLLLIGFGTIMVFSSSSVKDFSNSGNAFSSLTKQVMFLSAGLPIMLLISRLPLVFWKKWAIPFLVLACAAQVLVLTTSLGGVSGGNRNWINIGGITIQPSEFIKLGIALWLALAFTRKNVDPKNWRTLIGPILFIPFGAIGLVVAGFDLGTALIMASLVFAGAYYAGVKLKYLFTVLIAAGVFIFFAVVSSTSRLDRVMTFITQGCPDYEGMCWQPTHALYALSAGGVFGVGLGNSKAKWSWLPAAENDYIFAIIGEELGLIGALTVIALFVMLAVVMFRIIDANKENMFIRVFTGTVLVWITLQAFVNIAVVLEILPVLGVPLPFLSAGGSSLIANMMAMGVVLSFCRPKAQKPSRPGAERHAGQVTAVQQTPRQRSFS